MHYYSRTITAHGFALADLKANKLDYSAYTDEKIGAFPKALSAALCVPVYTVSVPEFEKLPGDASFVSSGPHVPFDQSFVGAFQGWDYSIMRKGKQLAIVLEPVDLPTDWGQIAWDWLCLRADCRALANNADEVDDKTGELRWKINRGKRKEKITFTLEAVDPVMKRGGW